MITFGDEIRMCKYFIHFGVFHYFYKFHSTFINMWDTMNLYGVLFWQGIIDIVNVTDVEVNSSIGGGGGRGCSGVVVVAGDIVTVVVVVVGGGGVLDGLHH